MNPTTEGCVTMAHNSKVSIQETLIFSSSMAPVALLVLFISLSIALPGALLAQDPPDPASAEEAAEESAREEANNSADANSAAETDDSAVSNPDMYRMEEGKFPVLSLMRFIQRTSGKFVNYPSTGNDPAFAEETFVDVVGDVDPLTYPIVQAILETNGYELWESTSTTAPW
jgi:hypothetical protein